MQMSSFDQPYRLSFSFGGLLIPEAEVIAGEFGASSDWDVVRRHVLDRNLLHKTRASSSRRYFREIRDRFSTAYPWELEVVARRASDADTAAVLFAIFSRYYRLVGDFVTQVVRRRFLDGLPSVDTPMLRAFMADQAPVHPEIAALSDTTADKLATVVIRALREAGIAEGRRGTLPIHPPEISGALRDRYCAKGALEDLAHLLYTDKEIAACRT